MRISDWSSDVCSSDLPFSYFPGSKINAWSYYDLGFTIEAFADISERIYARVGNTIYLFGGEDDETYPDAGEYPVTVEIPYLSANTPATRKSWHGIDVACTNDWQVRLQIGRASCRERVCQYV